MDRLVLRKLPSGETKTVQPFHVSIKGVTNVLCRDDEDYGVMVKYTAVCAHRKNVIVIIYAVVANHGHGAILACSYEDAYAYAQELKKNYAQWFQTKYLEKGILKGVSVQALSLDSDWYVRNTLAYIPRNSMDNGCPVDKYKWSGYRAMFRNSAQRISGIPVNKLTRREQDRILHTREHLKDVPWLIDGDGELMPETFCDVAYLEQVFDHDQAFFLKTIGTINPAEMQEKLVEAPRRMLPDSEFYKVVEDTAQRWFKTSLSLLPLEKKKRMLPYIRRSHKTTVNQLARVFKMNPDEVRDSLNHLYKTK